jgi:hypothetical protein
VGKKMTKRDCSSLALQDDDRSTQMEELEDKGKCIDATKMTRKDQKRDKCQSSGRPGITEPVGKGPAQHANAEL